MVSFHQARIQVHSRVQLINKQPSTISLIDPIMRPQTLDPISKLSSTLSLNPRSSSSSSISSSMQSSGGVGLGSMPDPSVTSKWALPSVLKPYLSKPSRVQEPPSSLSSETSLRTQARNDLSVPLHPARLSSSSRDELEAPRLPTLDLMTSLSDTGLIQDSTLSPPQLTLSTHSNQSRPPRPQSRRMSLSYLSEAAPRLRFLKDILTSREPSSSQARSTPSNLKPSQPPSSALRPNMMRLSSLKERLEVSHESRSQSESPLPRLKTVSGGTEFELMKNEEVMNGIKGDESNPKQSLELASCSLQDANLSIVWLPRISSSEQIREEAGEEEDLHQTEEGDQISEYLSTETDEMDVYRFRRPGSHLSNRLRGREVQDLISYRLNPTSSVALNEGHHQEEERIKSKTYRLREQKWIEILNSIPSSQSQSHKKIKRLIQGGIPKSLRGKVWSYVLRVDEVQTPGVYQTLMALEGLGDGRDGLEKSFKSIEADLVRCVPDHPRFRDG